MLKQLSRLERTRNVVIIGFAVLMGVSLLLFYAPSRNSANTAPAANSSEPLARVGNQDVIVSDLTAVKNELRETYERYGIPFNSAQAGGDRGMLNRLIGERVVAHEAARLNLAPSEAEIAAEIRRQFSPGGRFVGMERYKEIVSSRYGDLERFEQRIANSVAAQKLRAFVTSGVQVSEQEVQDEYKRRNTTFEVVYVPVTADKLAARIQPSDEEMRLYYEAHKADFRILEPQKKIRYLFIDQAKAGAKLQISDEELRREFDNLTPENKQAGVRVQQIVLRIARPDLDATVRAKADQLVGQARGETGNATEEAFAELARGNSEDPATARAGGALSGVVRRNPNKPDDPLQQTLEMQPGQVSDPIKYNNAYYIFRRGEAVPKTFEEAKESLVVSLRNQRSYAVAAQLAARAAERLRETRDVQQVAQELAAEANMTPAEMVRETGYVKPGDNVPEIGSSPQFEEAIAPLNNAGDPGDRVGVRGGFAVPLLVDKRDPRIPEFDEVREAVATRLKQERANSQLEQTARQLAANANGAADLRAAAGRLGLEAQTAADYKLGTALGEAGTSPVADDAINSLQAGEVAKTPIKIGDSWVVVGTTKRTEADLAEFAKERTDLMQTALTTRRNGVFEDFITAARARLEREGKIKIYDEVLARMALDEPPTVAPAPRRNAPPAPSGRQSP